MNVLKLQFPIQDLPSCSLACLGPGRVMQRFGGPVRLQVTSARSSG